MALTEEQLKNLPTPIDSLMAKLERDAVDKVCNRLKQVGQFSASDTHALSELARIGSDVDSIKQDIAKTMSLSEQEVYDLYYAASKADYDFQKTTFEKLGKPWVPFNENPQMIQIVESAARATIGEFTNLSLTTGFMGYIKQKRPNQFVLSKTGEYMLLDEYYQSTINYAIFQVRTGTEDYNSAMRKAIKEMSDSGLMTRISKDGTLYEAVAYDNVGKRPYTRRLDSSVRNAFMGGQQRLSRHQAAILGEQFGADGMEISWHSGSRPSHMWFAGKQYSMTDYQNKVVAENKTPEQLLEDYNCYHRAFPIVLGISTPTYSEPELRSMNAKELEKHSFEGKEYNKYEATQMQRKFETAIRREKDRAKAFAASGDSEAEKIALAKSAALNARYKEFSQAVELTPRSNKTTVVNFTRSQAGKLGWETRNAQSQKAQTKEAPLLAKTKQKDNNSAPNKTIEQLTKQPQALIKPTKQTTSLRTSPLPKVTRKELDGLSRESLETLATGVYAREHTELPEYEAIRRARALMDGNSTSQLKKYIYKSIGKS